MEASQVPTTETLRGGGSADPRVAQAKALRDSLDTEVLTAGELSGATVDHPIVSSLIALTREGMRHMNELHPGLPPDAPELTLGFVTRPGAQIVLLRGIIPGKEAEGSKILGYGLVFKGIENFPDREDIPPGLVSDNAFRVNRLFVTEEARKWMPRGEAFSKIIERIEGIAGDGVLIGKVLTGIVQKEGDFSGKDPAIWLDAKRALEMRGFIGSGNLFTERVDHADGKSVDICFRWYTWSKSSEEGQRVVNVQVQKFTEVARKNQEAIAWPATAIAIEGDNVAFTGNKQTAFDLANLNEGNLISAGYFPSAHASSREEGRPNLKISIAPADGRYFRDNEADAALIYGAIPDIAGQDPAAAVQKVKAFAANQVRQLKLGGSLIIRDTVRPDEPHSVVVELSEKKDLAVNGAAVSIADLFRKFVATAVEKHIDAEEWRSVTELRESNAGASRFFTPYSVLAEFKAKFAYASDWESERQRSYTLFTPKERIALMSELAPDLHLRLLYAAPEQSGWQYRNLFKGRIGVTNLAGDALNLPPTNFVTIAEKVASNEGLRLTEESRAIVHDAKFLRLAAYEEFDADGKVLGIREIASRPKFVHDVIPYTISRGRLWVRGRIYPRPIILAGQKSYDGSVVSGYQVEQSGAEFEKPIDAGDDAALNRSAEKIALERSGVAPDKISSFGRPTRYFTRPDMVDEQVFAQAVRMDTIADDVTAHGNILHAPGTFTTRTFDGVRLLQAAQIGAHQEGRMERKIYEILHANNMSCGPWLGAKLHLEPQRVEVPVQTDIEKIISPEGRTRFKKIEGIHPGFLEVYRGEFAEHSAESLASPEKKPLRSGPLEYVVPAESTGLGTTTLAVIPVIRRMIDGHEQILIGVEMRDFAAVQEVTGSSALATIPMFRMHASVSTLIDAKSEMRTRMQRDFGIELGACPSLGGKYRESPGITPDAIHLVVGEVLGNSSKLDKLQWIDLDTLHAHATELHCAQLISAVYRLKHALSARG